MWMLRRERSHWMAKNNTKEKRIPAPYSSVTWAFAGLLLRLSHSESSVRAPRVAFSKYKSAPRNVLFFYMAVIDIPKTHKLIQLLKFLSPNWIEISHSFSASSVGLGEKKEEKKKRSEAFLRWICVVVRTTQPLRKWEWNAARLWSDKGCFLIRRLHYTHKIRTGR